jgi:hypothetical protein
VAVGVAVAVAVGVAVAVAVATTVAVAVAVGVAVVEDPLPDLTTTVSPPPPPPLEELPEQPLIARKRTAAAAQQNDFDEIRRVLIESSPRHRAPPTTQPARALCFSESLSHIFTKDFLKKFRTSQKTVFFP